MLLASANSIVANLGSILSGLSALLVAVGSGVGFVLRRRAARRRERLRTEAAASLAAQEARRALEARLEQQHSAQVRTLENQLQEMRIMHQGQVEQYKNQIADLQRDREQLLSRILREVGEHD